MRHTTGIVQDLDFRPREIIKRERIGGIAKIIAPGFEERLLARPFGGQMDGLPVILLARAVGCLPHLTHGEQRTHARPRLRQMVGECGHIHHVMPQTTSIHASYCVPLRA